VQEGVRCAGSQGHRLDIAVHIRKRRSAAWRRYGPRLWRGYLSYRLAAVQLSRRSTRATRNRPNSVVIAPLYRSVATAIRNSTLRASFRCGVFDQAAVDPAYCCVVTHFYPITLVPEHIEPRSFRR
jgi:hypothetical protein